MDELKLLNGRMQELYYDIRRLLQLVKATWMFQNLNPDRRHARTTSNLEA